MGDSTMLITPTEILDSSTCDLPSKDLIEKLCKKKGSDTNHLIYSANGKNLFIKYNNTTMNEAHSQLFFYNQMRSKNNSRVRIPQIYHAFGPETGKAYIVMEHIDIDPERPASDEQRAQAISELISIPPPPGVFGSLTGSPVRHHFFRDSEPPVPFTTATELEGYVNRALEWFNNRVTGKQDQVNFRDEPLLCYYADIHCSNFPVDIHGQLWVIDFQQSGVLPASFMNYAIRAHPRNSLSIPIRKTIPLKNSPNLGAMGRATYVLKVVHNTFHIPPENNAEGDSEPVPTV